MLIEDGILKGYMQDRQNARLMGVAATGNGRRQSYASPVMPRMTNTYMLGGDKDPGEILASVKKGIYATNFGGGQVDITNGKFVFSCTEAYLIEDGKLGPAIKGATLIGSGPESLTRVSMIGNDMKLDTGIGTCGKNGQSVPVGVGQPTLQAGRTDRRRHGPGGMNEGPPHGQILVPAEKLRLWRHAQHLAGLGADHVSAAPPCSAWCCSVPPSAIMACA